MRILLVEDDELLGDGVRVGLIQYGYTVDWFKDGLTAQQAIMTENFDLVILDIGLPRRNGLEVLKSVRAKNLSIPVIILTARETIEDRVKGLDAGADDYLVKPFAVDELLARVRALLRRHSPSSSTATVLQLEDLTLDVNRREVHRGTRQIELTKTEFDLLQILLEQSGIVLSREYLYEHIWGFNFETNSKSLDVYIGYLRRKLEEGGESRLLHTARGFGYVVKPS